MAEQWYRRYQLIVGAQGQGVTIDNLTTSGFRIRFQITKSFQKEPNKAEFEIFNLGPEMAKKIEEEYTDAIFNAGYGRAADVELLFSGNTEYVSTYRDKTEWITKLECGDGDFVQRTAYVNKTFNAGATDESIVDFCLSQMGNIRKGVMQLFSGGGLRGRTFSKSATDTLDEVARSNGCNWSIQDGELQMVRADAMLDSDVAVVLTPETGLLEAAERTDKGIKARCLLNPSIKINSAIQLDNSSIKTESRQRKSITKGDRGRPVDLAADGIYKVFKLVHAGDTRGNDWTTEVLCVGLGQPIPTGTTGREAVPIGGATMTPEGGAQ